MRRLKFVLCAVLAVSALAVPAQANHGGAHSLIVSGPPAFGSSTSATFTFIGASDTSVDSCKLDDQAPTSCSKPSKTYTNLAPGTHSFTVDGTWHRMYCDIGGCFYEPDPRTDSWTWTIDVTKPTVTMTSPSAPFQLASDVTVMWTGSDGEGSGIDEYTVRRKTARGDQEFGAVTTEEIDGDQSSLSPVHIGDGFTKCFSVSAKDKAGNVSAFTPWRCTAKPRDDSLFEVNEGSPWTKITGDDTYWNGTLTKTTQLGAKLKSSDSLHVTRVGVVATVCPTCGSVRLKVGAATIGVISLVAPETKHQRLRSLPVFPLEIGVLKVITTTSGKPVELDGVAFSRK